MAVACLADSCCVVHRRPRALRHASKRARAPAPRWLEDAEGCYANSFRERTVDLGSPVGPTASRHWIADRLPYPGSFRVHLRSHRRSAVAEHYAKPCAGSPASECCWWGWHHGSEYCQPDAACSSFRRLALDSGPGLDSGSFLSPVLDSVLGFDCVRGLDSGRRLDSDPHLLPATADEMRRVHFAEVRHG